VLTSTCSLTQATVITRATLLSTSATRRCS